VFEIESEIAISIAGALEAELLPREREIISRHPTRSPRAYAQYLRAIDTWERATFGIQNEFPEIESHFNNAIKLDPDFARAYAGRALLYAVVASADSSGQQVFDDASRALELDERLGVAHAALAEYFARTWQGKKAIESFNRALDLSPGDFVVLAGYAQFLSNAGQHSRAIDLVQKMLSVAPNTAQSLERAARVYRMAGRYDVALDYARLRLEVAGQKAGDWLNAAGIEVARGNLEIALDYMRQAEEMPGGLEGSLASAYTYRLAGDHQSAVRHAGTQVPELDQRRGVPYGLLLGDYVAAFEEVSRRIQDRSAQGGPYWLVKNNAWNDPILNQPEWIALRDQMGYPDLQ
jgi:tetratricopeptide (TPR) repeat protein